MNDNIKKITIELKEDGNYSFLIKTKNNEIIDIPRVKVYEEDETIKILKEIKESLVEKFTEESLNIKIDIVAKALANFDNDNQDLYYYKIRKSN